MIEFTKQVFVESDEKLIYKIKDIEVFGNGIAYIHLELVCGYDYIDPDTSDIQGYVDKSLFVEEVQDETVSCDILTESLLEALNDMGYRVKNELPKIHKKGAKE